MKKNILYALIGLVVGIILTGVVMYKLAPGLMMLEDQSAYGFDETVAKFNQSVLDHGWKVSKIHDLQKSMAKFGKTVKPVQVFELCHPDHAGKILMKNDERIVSSLMPCRVSFYVKDDGKVYISRMNSSLMASMMAGIIPEVMDDAAKDTEKMLNSVLAK